MDLPLLTTKLFAPPPRPSLVPRPHLLARLDEALSPACRLALLSAPAGFGKTTLVSEWCESLAKRGLPLAWLTLDAEDNRPARLLHYLVAAVQRVYPEMGRSAQAVLDQPQALPVESVLTSLINELAGLTADFVLVLDDYHTLNGQAIHPVMAFLLEHHPPQMHLVILTRQEAARSCRWPACALAANWSSCAPPICVSAPVKPLPFSNRLWGRLLACRACQPGRSSAWRRTPKAG